SLGVALGATYKHVPNKDELMRLVAHELYSRIHPTGQQVRDPLDSVLSLLIRFEGVFSASPGMAFYLSQHFIELTPPHLTKAMRDALFEAGFPEVGVARVMRAVFFYTSGAMLTTLPDKRSRKQEAAQFAEGLDIVLAGVRLELERRRVGRGRGGRGASASPSRTSS